MYYLFLQVQIFIFFCKFEIQKHIKSYLYQ